ncbi:zinc-binding alcohol dehydrogenase family protein [Undibacterium sp. SXout7W]|uniref:zinc-binding alcohol dehydrogenase family protein n=1 Tax=Undibacterium sp. SXout7W TaxID=3413049 RepID=UPI003BF3E6AC
MKAVGYHHPHPVDHALALEDLDLPDPVPLARDLLVRVSAISVNPVDTKVRAAKSPDAGQIKVLGWDAVGVVEQTGSDVTQFKVGDRVYYAGAINRAGANSELHVVDERIVALAPATLNDASAAALPLTTITAYELLFERLQVPKHGGAGQTLLITGGAGGVGSILIQLARQLTQLKVIATASRPETRQWCLDLGAHAVIDHSRPLNEELQAIGITEIDLVASLTNTQQHFQSIITSLKPQGRLGVIDDMGALDVMQLKPKSISLHWEMMFTRSMFETADMAEQGRLLAEVAALIDTGAIRTTVNAHFGQMNADNLRRAHALIESGKAQGKIVLSVS